MFSIWKGIEIMFLNRVSIELPENNLNNKNELPCKIGVVADFFENNFNPPTKSFQERSFIQLNCDHFNQFVEILQPKLSVLVEDILIRRDAPKQKRQFNLKFNRIEDFAPGALIDQVPDLAHIFKRMNIMDNVLNDEDGIERLCFYLKEIKAIDHPFKGKKYPPDHVNPDHVFAYPTPDLLMTASLESMVFNIGKIFYQNYPACYEKEDGFINYSELAEEVLAFLIAASQRLLEDQINKIIASPEYKRLEASLLGLKKLFDQIKKNNQKKNIKLFVLPASWKEIAEDVQRFDSQKNSRIFHKIYDELDMPGGEPFTCVIFDYAVNHLISEESNRPFVETLTSLSQIAAASFCPFIFSADPELFELNSFQSMSPFIKFDKVFSSQEYVNWNAFRRQLDTRFIAIVAPQVLERLPYHESFDIQPGVKDRNTKIGVIVKRNFYFIEDIHSDKDYVWGNGGYSLACVIARSFAKTGWFEFIRGVSDSENSKEQVDGSLPNILFDDERHAHLPVGFERHQSTYNPSFATSCFVTENIEQQLDYFGFIPIASHPGKPSGVFFHVSSLYDTGIDRRNIDSWASDRLSSSLHYILCGSRFAHYIKVIGRDKIGSLTSSQKLEDYLQDWLMQYIKNDDRVIGENRNIGNYFPLVEGIVHVEPRENQLGIFDVEIHLKPKFQSENIISTIKLVTEIRSRG